MVVILPKKNILVHKINDGYTEILLTHSMPDFELTNLSFGYLYCCMKTEIYTELEFYIIKGTIRSLSTFTNPR